MALEIETRHTEKIDPKAKIAGERMMFNADGSMLVRDGDVRARTLAVAEGHRMHPDLVKRFRIKGGKLDTSGANKALKGTENKGG
jgi:hypothetical protein